MRCRIRPLEVSWFAALCDDDYQYLGVADPRLQSSYEHCAEIVRCAASGGFDSCLLPSGYELGIDSVAFAGAVAPWVERMQLLVAVRCAELWPRFKPPVRHEGSRYAWSPGAAFGTSVE